MLLKKNICVGLAFLMWIPVCVIAGIEPAMNTQLERQDANKASQQRIDNLSDKQQKLLGEYRELTHKERVARVYNQHMQTLTNAQQSEIDSLNQQLQDIEKVQKELVPWMLEMVADLEEWVASDAPFLLDERQARVTQLKNLMGRADIGMADKYRRVMEAYQAELSYTSSSETYKGPIPYLNDDGRSWNGSLLRIGRLALYYTSPDEKQGGLWSSHHRQWITLDEADVKRVVAAMRIVDKVDTPDFLALPLESLSIWAENAVSAQEASQ